MSIVQVIVVCSSPKPKTLSKPEPVQTGIKLCPQGIPVWTGFALLHLLVVLSVTKHIARLLDLEIKVLTLKMTFSHQNNTRNGILSQNHIKHKFYTSCYLCLLKIIFFYTFDLDLLILKISLKMTFNQRNNTINGLSSQNSMK